LSYFTPDRTKLIRVRRVRLVRRVNTTPLDLANYCLKVMDANDRILVTEVPGNSVGR